MFLQKICIAFVVLVFTNSVYACWGEVSLDKKIYFIIDDGAMQGVTLDKQNDDGFLVGDLYEPTTPASEKFKMRYYLEITSEGTDEFGKVTKTFWHGKTCVQAVVSLYPPISNAISDIYTEEVSLRHLEKDIVIEAHVSYSNGVASYNIDLIHAASAQIFDSLNFKENIFTKYELREGRAYHIQLVQRDIYRKIQKFLKLNRAKVDQIFSQDDKADCLGDKDTLSEQYVDFKYQEYPSKCEKYTDGFNIMDSMVKLYKSCPDLDKGTGKRAQIKEQYYKMKKQKAQHCN